MRKIIAGVLAGVTLLSGVTVASTADAQNYRYGNRYYNDGWRRDRNRDDDGAAIVAGIAGLAIGAALASGNNRGYGQPYYGGYYSDPYARGYAPGYGYGYGQGYYAPPRGYAQRCRTVTMWDPYYGRVRQRQCW